MLKTKLATLLAAGTMLIGAGATATTAFADDNNSGEQPSSTEVSSTQRQSDVSFYGNDGKTTWTNVYQVFSPNDHTPARKKENKTAYYNHTKKCNIGYITIWAALYDGRDVSSGHSYRSYAGDTTYLYNTAVENYGKGVAVRIDSVAYNNGKASGTWSPDRH